MISGVYMIRCVKTGHCYIGSSRNIRKRWERHRNECANNNHHNSWLQRAWIKYGAEAFEFLVLEECGENRVEREQHYMDSCGKNMKNASKLAHCAETTPKKRRQSSITAKRLIAEGRFGPACITPEMRFRISAAVSKAKKGTKHKPESIEKMRVSQARVKKDLKNKAHHKRRCEEHARVYWTPERRAEQAARRAKQGDIRWGTR